MNKFVLFCSFVSLFLAAALPARAQYDIPSTPMVTATPAATAVTVTPGWWYNPNEGGSGYGISVNSAGHIFLGAFGYSDTGNGAADWIYAVLTSGTTNVYSGPITHCTKGQPLSSSTFVSPTCASTGQTLQLTFTDSNNATLQFSGGRSTQIQLFTSY